MRLAAKAARFRPREKSRATASAKPRHVLVLVGTRKGAFVFRSDPARKHWSVEGPLLRGKQVHHFIADPHDALHRMWAAANDDWFGSDIQRTANGGKTWTGSKEGVRYEQDSGLSVKRIWHIRPAEAQGKDVVYCGVDPAGLFRSEDGGHSWGEMKGLNRHETRSRWTPGAGGLIVHTILPDPSIPGRLYVAISAAGVFRSDDNGASWVPRNQGTRADFLPEKFPDLGQCVHKLALSPRVDLLYQQNHCGMYRSANGGDTWEDISEGLPSRFGFPIAVHPRDPQMLWVVPLIGAEMRVTPKGELAVYRSANGGKSWQKQTRGLPTRNAHLTILREAMARDECDPAGVYLGTENGQLFYSRNEGREWQLLSEFLPPILSVEAAVV
jgi:hypothetical protein